MPQINVTFCERDERIATIMCESGNKLRLREALCRVFPGYAVDEVEVIPNIILDDHLKYADNIAPLQFKIDLGTQEKMLSDVVAEKICIAFGEEITALLNVHFRVWAREMQSNGFHEYNANQD